MFSYKQNTVKKLSDLNTPTELFLKIRKKFPDAILLESSDYNSIENSKSFICFKSISNISLTTESCRIKYPDGNKKTLPNNKNFSWTEELKKYLSVFNIKKNKSTSNIINSGVYGYSCFDLIPNIEKIKFKPYKNKYPLAEYHLYKYSIVFEHFNNILHYVSLGDFEINFDTLFETTSISKNNISISKKKTSSFTDKQFMDIIEECREHCKKGNVFQIVPSRQFKRKFKGDPFLLYRHLRSVSPTPYQFFFNFKDVIILGCSPEAQLIVSENKAEIHPIAGTFKRTGDDAKDTKLAQSLLKDKKENAEHIMLVDLARNDLSKYCTDVKVKSFKETQFYSHVIHLTSVVKGTLKKNYSGIDIFYSTFPAGTLSGAPKYKALQIINKIEKENRGTYGGAVGFLGLDGSVYHAITIRSITCIDNNLIYQAGAGVVFKSNTKSELKEVFNKLRSIELTISQIQ